MPYFFFFRSIHLTSFLLNKTKQKNELLHCQAFQLLLIDFHLELRQDQYNTQGQQMERIFQNASFCSSTISIL